MHMCTLETRRDETRREAGGGIYNNRCVYVLQIGGVENIRN